MPIASGTLIMFYLSKYKPSPKTKTWKLAKDDPRQWHVSSTLAGVTRLGEFSPLYDNLAWAVFGKLQK
jgi:hypothetical protein